ncbi:hypothetical protein ACNBSK_004644 [Escherichia coli]|nr:hypothetical protein [Escherichia coli]SQK48778.1 transposase for ISEc12 [Escherichia coli]
MMFWLNANSRCLMFLGGDAPALLPLPLTSYEYTEFRAVKVAPDNHVEYARHCYELVGQRLSLKPVKR